MGISSTMENNDQIQYKKAQKRVKEIKGFYFHLMIFIVINIFILINIFIANDYNSEEFWRIESFFTIIFWGVGLLIHASAVFNHSYLWGKNWEERKIKELLDKEDNKDKKL